MQQHAIRPTHRTLPTIQTAIARMRRPPAARKLRAIFGQKAGSRLRDDATSQPVRPHRQNSPSSKRHASGEQASHVAQQNVEGTDVPTAVGNNQIRMLLTRFDKLKKHGPDRAVILLQD
jgi:hypothetical protein